jgi:tetratricopeptide (TPR) repeat protein
LILVSFAPADQLIVAGRNHPGAKIISFDQAKVQFRAADGSQQSAWIDEIDFLNVDRGGAWLDLNEAERYLGKGDLDNALIRYRRAARGLGDFWSDLADARWLRACNRADLIDQAATAYLRVLRAKSGGPAVAARLIPRNLPTRSDAKVTAALETLEAAVSKEKDDERLPALELFRFELLRQVSLPQAPKAVRSLAVRGIPPLMRCERAFSIQLAALEQALSDEADGDEWRALDAVIRDCPLPSLPRALVLKGEVLLRSAGTREELIRASWPFLRVAIHVPDSPLAPDGLYAAASVMERIGRADRAAALLKECLAHPQLSDATRGRAEAMLTGLSSQGEAAP